MTCAFPGCDLPAARRFCSAEHRERFWASQNRTPKKIPRAQRLAEAAGATCSQCHGPVEIERAARAISRGWETFCSDRCRNRFHRALRAKKDVARQRSCRICDRPITLARRKHKPATKTCSEKCVKEARAVGQRIKLARSGRLAGLEPRTPEQRREPQTTTHFRGVSGFNAGACGTHVQPTQFVESDPTCLMCRLLKGQT